MGLFGSRFSPIVTRFSLRNAPATGGDADTVGAMTGTISGAYHGASVILSDWLAALENGPKGHDYVQGLAADLFDSWRRWRATAPFA